MTVPHKNAAVLHAMAEGSQGQILTEDGVWVDVHRNTEYRLVPIKLTYRMYVWRGFDRPVELRWVNNYADGKAVSKMASFVRWVHDAQEVEV